MHGVHVVTRRPGSLLIFGSALACVLAVLGWLVVSARPQEPLATAATTSSPLCAPDRYDPKPRCVVKPADFGIMLPWTQGRVVFRGPNAYGVGDHVGSDSYALDFMIGPEQPAGVPSGGRGGVKGHERDIRAVASGTIVWAGLYDDGTSRHCLGNSVAILHDYTDSAENTYTSFYANLASFTLNGKRVSPQAMLFAHVNQGDVIGIEGSSGNDLPGCDSHMPPHLTFALYQNASTGHPVGSTMPLGGAAVIPEPFMGQDSSGRLTTYQNFEWFQGPMIAGGKLASNGTPHGTWTTGALPDLAQVTYGSPVHFGVHLSDAVNIAEVRFTADYLNEPWNYPGSFSTPVAFLSHNDWRVVGECMLSGGNATCRGGLGTGPEAPDQAT